MSRRGISLIETIVGASILALVMLSVLAIMTMANRASVKAEYRAKATALSENLLEEMRHRPYAELAPGGPSPVAFNPDEWDVPNLGATATISEVPGFDGRLKEIVLVVNWTEFGRPGELIQTVRLSSMRR